MNLNSLNQPATNNHLTLAKTIILSKDLCMGESQGEYLFKLCGSDEVVWIPGEMIHPSHTHNNAYEITFAADTLFSCAKIMISNYIRLCLIKQHQVKAKQILPYLLQSEKLIKS